jgi:hypothetical protein
MSANCSPGVLPAQDDSNTQARHSKIDLNFAEDRFIPAWCHRNAAVALRNHGGDGVIHAGRVVAWRVMGDREIANFSLNAMISAPLKLGEDDFLSP